MTDKEPAQNQRDLINYRFDEVFKRLDRMEGKMDNFAFVNQSDFDAFRKEIKDTYVTKESFDPVKRVVYGVVALILVTVGGVILSGALK